MTEYNIRLNPNCAAAVHTGLKFKAGDKGITFRIAVDELDTTGTTAKIVFLRANGTSVESDITGTEVVYRYKTLGNEFAVPGKTIADVKVYSGGDRVSTASFMFEVCVDTMDGLGAGTGGYSDQLEKLTKEAKEVTKEAELIKDDLQNTLEEYKSQLGNVGAVSSAGYYSASKAYVVNNVVFHNGYSWLCVKNCTGQEPTGTSAYWQKFTTGIPVDLVDTATGVACKMTLEDGIITIREA